MSRQPRLRPKTHIPGLPEDWCDSTAAAKLNELEYGQGATSDRREHRVFRVKRKHVLKACDRCRVKKTKVSERDSWTGETCIYLLRISVTGSSLATAVRRITIRAYFGSEMPRKRKYTREGKRQDHEHAPRQREIRVLTNFVGYTGLLKCSSLTTLWS